MEISRGKFWLMTWPWGMILRIGDRGFEIRQAKGYPGGLFYQDASLISGRGHYFLGLRFEWLK